MRRADALEVRRGAVSSVACFREGRETRERATRERSTARGDARRGGARSASAARAGRALRLGRATCGRACECRARLARAFRARGERHETASDSRRSAKPRRWFHTETKERRDRRSKGKPQTARRSIERRSHTGMTGRKYGETRAGDEREERKIDFARIRAARSVVGRGYCLLSHPKRTQNTLDTEYATPNTPSHDHRYVQQTTASSIR